MKLHNSLIARLYNVLFEGVVLLRANIPLNWKAIWITLLHFRQLLFSHRQSLTKSLASETNPALVIHITSVLLFQLVTNSMLHATGKFVPLITSFLKKHMKEDQHQLLLKGQGKCVSIIDFHFNALKVHFLFQSWLLNSLTCLLIMEIMMHKRKSLMKHWSLSFLR